MGDLSTMPIPSRNGVRDYEKELRHFGLDTIEEVLKIYGSEYIGHFLQVCIVVCVELLNEIKACKILIQFSGVLSSYAESDILKNILPTVNCFLLLVIMCIKILVGEGQLKNIFSSNSSFH